MTRPTWIVCEQDNPREFISCGHDAHGTAPWALSRAAAQCADFDHVNFPRNRRRQDHPPRARVFGRRFRPRHAVVQAETQQIHAPVDHRSAAHQQLRAHAVVNGVDLRRVQRAGRAVVVLRAAARPNFLRHRQITTPPGLAKLLRVRRPALQWRSEPRTTRTTRTIHFLTTDSLLAQLPTAISNLPN